MPVFLGRDGASFVPLDGGPDLVGDDRAGQPAPPDGEVVEPFEIVAGAAGSGIDDGEQVIAGGLDEPASFEPAKDGVLHGANVAGARGFPPLMDDGLHHRLPGALGKLGVTGGKEHPPKGQVHRRDALRVVLGGQQPTRLLAVGVWRLSRWFVMRLWA